MPSLRDRIESDYKEALRGGQRLRVDTLRLVKAAVQRVAMDKRKDSLEDGEIIQVIGQQLKQRRETLESAKGTGRQDILDQSNQELQILEAYMPQQISDEAIIQLIEEALKLVGKNQGQIMKHVMAKAAGTAEGKRVSQLVIKHLQG